MMIKVRKAERIILDEETAHGRYMRYKNGNIVRSCKEKRTIIGNTATKPVDLFIQKYQCIVRNAKYRLLFDDPKEFIREKECSEVDKTSKYQKIDRNTLTNFKPEFPQTRNKIEIKE